MPGLERQRVAADQVRPLVAVHAHAVADAMGEVGVVGHVAGVDDDLARGGVHRLVRISASGTFDRSGLMSRIGVP